MKTLTTNAFFESLNMKYIHQIIEKMDRELNEVVKPNLGGENQVGYVHFMTLENGVCVSADTLYDFGYRSVARTIKKIRVYESELDMEFYMALAEYENTLDPNTVLYGGLGTAADLDRTYIQNIIAMGIESQIWN